MTIPQDAILRFTEPRIRALRAALPPQAFSEAEARGRALSYEEAIAEARGWLEPLA